MDLDQAARRVWDYHHVGHALAPADCSRSSSSPAGWARSPAGCSTGRRPRSSPAARPSWAFTRELLRVRGLTVGKAIAVQKPYMERRALATFRQLWPGVIVTSPQVAFDAYPNRTFRRDDVVHVMVGGPAEAHGVRGEGLERTAGDPARGAGGLPAVW